jgi:tetratricopeptide (TPR) repeat protein
VSTEAGTRLLDQAIESYLASRSDTPTLLKQAMTEDPDHLMARCFMGYLTRLAGDRRNASRSAAVHRGLAEAVLAGAGTDWERRHITALGLWLADDLHGLMNHFEQLLAAFPTDVLALRMLHYLYFYDGDAVRMRDSVAAQLPCYAGHPLEGYVKGMLAFGLEEAGDYAPAERLGREAVEANSQDAWAAHAVAHVMQMQGRSAEGIDWIDRLRPQWHETNNFRFHLGWHQALYHLARHDLDAVLAIYDQEVGPAIKDDFYLDLCNAASLLLRLEAVGKDVGERWTPLALIAEQHVEDTELVFASLHYLMPLVRTDSPAASRLLTALQQWAERDTTQGHVVRDVALDVAAFLVAVRRADSAAAVSRFDAFRAHLHRIGGSHAQRELFEIMRRVIQP